VNIYFVGYLTSHFIQDDVEILEEDHNLTIFDLSVNASSFKTIHTYLSSTLWEWRKVYNSDVVWIWFADYPALPFIVWAKLFRKPVVIRIAGWEVYSAPSINYGNQLNPIRGAVSRWIIRNATICVTPSVAYEKIIKALEPGANIITIPNSVDIKMCEGVLPVKHGVVTALTSMKFTRDLKGIPTFEKATSGLDARVIENAPHDELIEILKASKVYCQLSYTESFCVTLLEAMACGCIPVVTDKDALPEVVGDCGLLVPYGDVEKTRAAILLALKAGSADIKSVRNRAKIFSRERERESKNRLLERLCPHL
jgi:glycosyltransferase involved in cell wall biosynthesis